MASRPKLTQLSPNSAFIAPSTHPLKEAFLSRTTGICQRNCSVAGSYHLTQDADQFLLLREMHHRFANTFMLLTATLRRELGPSVQPELQGSLERCEARIVALSNLHRFLTIGGHGDWISVRFYVEHLCEVLAEAVLKPLGVRCEVSAADGIYPSERCELLGLIIAELVTNAAKHAFHDRDDCLVRIEFATNTDSWICMVSDNGVGSPAMSSGVGYRTLQPLLRALDANLVRKSGSGGTSITVAGQLSRRPHPLSVQQQTTL